MSRCDDCELHDCSECPASKFVKIAGNENGYIFEIIVKENPNTVAWKTKINGKEYGKYILTEDMPIEKAVMLMTQQALHCIGEVRNGQTEE